MENLIKFGSVVKESISRTNNVARDLYICMRYIYPAIKDLFRQFQSDYTSPNALISSVCPVIGRY